MELRDLKAYLTLAQVLHFGEAAARQHVTQSALSKQIRRLEEALGGALFSRSAGRTQLTALGQGLLAEADELVRRAEQLPRSARELLAGQAGCLRIGFGESSNRLVPAAIARFRAARPQVTIELQDLSTHHQIMALNEGRLDLGFCRLPGPKGWPSLPVLTANFTAVLPQHYPAQLDLAALMDYPLACIRRDKAPSFHDHLMKYLAQQGLRPRQMQWLNDFAAGVALAAAGVAWTLVPGDVTQPRPEIRTLPIQDPDAGWTIGLIRPPGPASALVQAFWQTVASLAPQPMPRPA
ncbi:LysR family transcriptional regulator [Pseudaeromonas sp. ZJS20]|uniref:LysR family transcriptional regulator n=1 Tax=Pseudaeromonas aegiceratis TaxID=3153928 RepID=UPI00390CBAB3